MIDSPLKSEKPVDLKSTASVVLLDDSASDHDEIYSNLPDSDSDDGMGEDTKGDFYFQNPKWPVWSRRSEGLPCEQLFSLIMHDATKQSGIICRSRPVAVRHNALFVVDLSSVPLKDLTSDDNGSWEVSTPRRMYTIEKNNDTGTILSIKRASTPGTDVYTLIRQYGTHKATKLEKGIEFKRMVATVKNSTGNILPYAILHYFFKSGKEEDIVLAPHGNA